MLANRDIPLRNGDRALRAVIQSLFVSELVYPSRMLYLVYPWISDVGVLDNTSGQFATLTPTFGYEHVTLSSVLIELARRGTSVVVASRPPSQTNRFFEAMHHASEVLSAGLVNLRYAEELHEKGMLSEHFYVSGSFNFTENGIEILEETATLTLDEDRIGRKLLDFDRRWVSEWHP